LSWDGVHEGVVVVTVVRNDYVLGVPVTDTLAGRSAINTTFAGSRLSLWPQLETGLGRFLLHRRLGSALTVKQVRELRLWALGRGELATLVQGEADDDVNALRDLVGEYQRRCFIEWPSATEATIDVDAIGMTPREFQEHTGLEAGRVVELWDGQYLTQQDREALGENADAWSACVIDNPTRELASPELKDLVLELSTAKMVSEREARNAARSAYALAARTDTVTSRTPTRAADTLRMLIDDAYAS
jgi:hypothetical protein